MTDSKIPPAWIDIASEEQLRELFPKDADVGYDFGFLPAMTRLIATHPRIGPLFGMMYSEIMFSPDSVLTRKEAEMVAGVAAASQDCFY